MDAPQGMTCNARVCKRCHLVAVPFNVPSFGDAGHMFDPFAYLGLLSGVTRDIALGVASIILPLRHMAHVAKAAASADQLSGGRLLLGVASGDRPEEYPAMGMRFPDRGERFRESLAYVRAVAADYPTHNGAYGSYGPISLSCAATGSIMSRSTSDLTKLPSKTR